MTTDTGDATSKQTIYDVAVSVQGVIAFLMLQGAEPDQEMYKSTQKALTDGLLELHPDGLTNSDGTPGVLSNKEGLKVLEKLAGIAAKNLINEVATATSHLDLVDIDRQQMIDALQSTPVSKRAGFEQSQDKKGKIPPTSKVIQSVENCDKYCDLAKHGKKFQAKIHVAKSTAMAHVQSRGG